MAYQTWNTTELVSFVEDWKTSHRTVTIHGETLLVSGEACPVVILAFEEPECPVEMSSPQATPQSPPSPLSISPSTQIPVGYTAPNFALIGGVSAGTAFLFMSVIIMVIYVCKKWKR